MHIKIVIRWWAHVNIIPSFSRPPPLLDLCSAKQIWTYDILYWTKSLVHWLLGLVFSEPALLEDSRDWTWNLWDSKHVVDNGALVPSQSGEFCSACDIGRTILSTENSSIKMAHCCILWDQGSWQSQAKMFGLLREYRIHTTEHFFEEYG